MVAELMGHSPPRRGAGGVAAGSSWGWGTGWVCPSGIEVLVVELCPQRERLQPVLDQGALK